MTAGNTEVSSASVNAENPVHPPPEESKADRTRRTILEAAIERFGRDGYRATSVAEISRHAGVSGSLAYAYFANKEELFRSALDHDAAEVIHQGVTDVLEAGSFDTSWQEHTFLTLITTVDRHPLTRRVLAGLEPHVTNKMLALPALDDLRGAVAERLTLGQSEGLVRDDVDPVVMARAAVHLWIVLLMAGIQFGFDDMDAELDAIRRLFRAAMVKPGS